MKGLIVLCVCGVLYPYLIYPLILALVARRRNRATDGSYFPRVAILISAYNEERHIAAKVQNFLELEYPAEKLEMWVGLDGSSDGTAAILKNCGNARVHVLEHEERGGKTAMLNELAARAKADVFLFTDVNPLYRREAVREMVQPFADPEVGLVSGQTRVRGAGNVAVEGAYYRFEHWLKMRESWRGWLAGALGPNYAIRAGLYEPLDTALINDLAHPGLVAAKGYQCVFREESVIEEDAGDDAGREFSRQTRMTAQGAYVLARLFPRLLASGSWGMLWVLGSHKLLRWALGLWVVLGVATLAAAGWWWVVAAGFAGLSLLGWGWRGGAKWAMLPGFFLMVHTAYVVALCQALRGERYVTWKPRSG
jgi:cellulose synthase/poly-beta-1,6-N-acetylglucosamine synthase-like glycosyltransferase